MSEPLSLVFTRTIKAAPAEVCRAFTHATLLRDWLSDFASSKPHPGGHLFLSWRDGTTAAGTYQQLDPPRALQFTWEAKDLPGPTLIRVTCEGEGEGTRLSLTQESLEGGVDWNAAASRLQDFWTEALENLASVVEAGVDLRPARRPRLGIVYDELTAEKAGALGLPEAQGVLLRGTAEGSGAQAAGLLKDDVLVSLNGVPLVNADSFGTALSGLKAGDRPMVEYYRGPEKRSTPLELGTFPIPEPPPDAAALAARVRELYAEVLTAMREPVDGLTDEQADVRPAEGEWSVKELVAHFVLMERDYQSWMADMLNDIPVEDWLEMRPNVQPRITALTARQGSLAALLDELSLAQEETAAMIQALPESFTRDRKHLYQRAAQWEIEGIQGHYFEEHKEQFQKAIEAAKGKENATMDGGR
jgi:uncharacterized protein YndB with AHSA1/START domain